ncbi:MAG: ATP-binding protein [Sulfurifustis sp.]
MPISLRQRFQSALRYKLLALVLLPLLAAMFGTLGYTLYWFHGYTERSLNVTLRDHLTAARQALREYQDERQVALQQLAESAQFHALIKRHDRAAIQRALARLRDAKDFAFLHVTGPAGNWLYEDAPLNQASKPSPLTDRAGRGLSGAALELFRDEDLRRESAALAQQAKMESLPEPGAVGLVLRVVQPITDEQGRVSMILDGGILFNRNNAAIYTIGHRIVGAASFPNAARPVVAILLGDTRIATLDREINALVGTHGPQPGDRPEAKRALREALGDASYVSTYGTLYDIDNQPIGTLQVGMRASAFRADYLRSASLLLALFLIATAVAAWIAVRGVRRLLVPVERMTAVVRATRAGEDRRIGPIDTRDEIGELARQFDTMLDQLSARNREIQRAAAALETKVAERTRELEQKNAELQATIRLLEETREQLVLADKLSALGKMAAGIAHEINNPAAVILGNLDVLTAELGANAAPVAGEIDLIARQVERIRHIVTSLLQFARARPGAGGLAEVRVNQLVEDVAPLVAHALKSKSIRLEPRLNATGSIIINAFDLEQVLINLIVNAAHACRPGGNIEITTADPPEGGAMISVRDDGCGIAPEHLGHIFDPFFTTDPQRGAGLGLSVSYGLVQRHGGKITVESKRGRGTVFRVLLPKRSTAKEAAHARSPEEMTYD